jgi:NADH:ubiquinone oxidoreductase subunit 6 (subunit J)
MASAGLFTVLTIAFVSDSSQFNSVDRSGVDIETLATVLFEKWALPFEIASLVLLVALVGAIVIARSGGPEERS